MPAVARQAHNAKARRSTAGSRKKGKAKKHGSHESQSLAEAQDPNAEVLAPKSQEDKEKERKARMLEELHAQTESKWTAKKKKRLEKYIEKKLKKEERLVLFEKLAQSQAALPSSALQSSSTLGTGRAITHTETAAIAEDRLVNKILSGRIGKRKRAKVSYGDDEDTGSEDGSGSDGDDGPLPGPVISVPDPDLDQEDDRIHIAPEQTPSLSQPPTVSLHEHKPIGSALKRSADGTIKPVVVRKVNKSKSIPRAWSKRRPPTPEPQSESSFDSSDSGGDSDGDSEHSDSSEDDDGDGREAGSEEEESDGSEGSTQDPGAVPTRLVETQKTRSLGFKEWATKQLNRAKGYDDSDKAEPPTTDISQPPPKKRRTEGVPGPMRGPLGEDYATPATTFAQQVLSTQTPKGYVKVVDVKRTPEVEESRLLLPIITEEQPIMEAILMNPVVVICGETGSGKTTQLPQFLYEAGFGSPGSENPGMIGITQPRRVAAVSMAARVAHELALSSSQVSHQIRYDVTVSPSTSIKFMTDGVLLRELATDFLLTKYSVIIIDEAHERSVNTDILIGVLSRVIKLREQMWKDGKEGIKPLRMIIMSATLRVSDFAENRTLFPTPPPVITVAARQHPVTIHFSRRTHSDYVSQAVQKTCKIHTRLPPGGILIFLTGQNEISGVCRRLEAKFGKAALEDKQRRRGKSTQQRIEDIWNTPPEEEKRTITAAQADLEAEEIDLGTPNEDLADDVDGEGGEEDPDGLDSEEDELDNELQIEEESDVPMHVVPLYSLLPSDKQMRVFQPPPPGSRLVVVSTNIAETSLTIPGIRYVVDCGRAKERQYDIQSGIQAFKVSWISKASAAQRAGRAGRTGPGHCYRLYSSALFENHFDKFAKPEILRIPIEGLVLQMKSIHIDSVANFPFPTPPDRLTLRKAERSLTYLGGLTQPPIAANKEGQITELGRAMALFPLAPRFSRMLVSGQQNGCLPYVICIVSALSVGDPFLYEESLGLGQDSEDDEMSDLEGDGTTPKERRQRIRKQFHQSRLIHSSLGNHTSDVFKILSVVGAYEYARGGQNFCAKHFVRPKAMEEIHKLRAQISNLVSLNFPDVDPRFEAALPPPTDLQFKTLRQLLAAAFIDQVAVRKDLVDKKEASGAKYATSNGVAYRAMGVQGDVFVHPSSLLAGRPPPDYVVYQELVHTSRVFMKGLTIINPAWLWALGKHTLCTTSKPVKNSSGVLMVIPRFGPDGWELPPVRVTQ